MHRSTFTKLCSGLGLSLALIGMTGKAQDSRAVYTTDNAASANHVLVFQREENGQVSSAGSVATGGTGAGAGLSNQGAVLLSHDGRWLFVCNAGSDDISVLATGSGHVQLVNKVSSGGHRPLSLAMHHNLLYVLNAGGSVGDKDNVTAVLFVDGNLVALPGSTRALSGDNTGPAQVSLTKDGDVLIVTPERLTSLIDTFTLGDDGLAVSHQTSPSSGRNAIRLCGWAKQPHLRLGSQWSAQRQFRVFVQRFGLGRPRGNQRVSPNRTAGGVLADALSG